MKRVKKSVSKINERSRYRLAIPLMFKVIEATQEKLISDEAHKTTTIDVSSGGVRFHCDLPLRLGDVLKIKLNFPAEEIIAIGQVVRIESAEETEETEDLVEGSNAVALEFIELPSERKERIRQLITPTLSLKREEPEEEQEQEGLEKRRRDCQKPKSHLSIPATSCPNSRSPKSRSKQPIAATGQSKASSAFTCSIQEWTLFSRMSMGTAPEPKIRSWKARMSNLVPSSC